MNKKTKSALKVIVKECLIEILAEGLVGNKQATLKESRELRGTLHETNDRLISETKINSTRSRVSSRKQTEKPKSYLDNITMGIDNQKRDYHAEKDEIKSKVSHLAKDDIMADILADTAMTTLREQKEGARPNGPSVQASGDQAAKIVDQSEPSDLFGGASANWANLAFASSSRK